MDMSAGFVSDPGVCTANAAVSGPAPGEDGVVAMARLAGSCDAINGRGGGRRSSSAQYWKVYCSDLGRARVTVRIVLGLDDNDGEVCLVADPGGGHVNKNTTINLDDGGRRSGLMLDALLYLALALLLLWMPCPDAVLRRVLEVVNLGPDDVHIDLGCREGRFNFAQSTPRSTSRRVGGWTLIQTYC
jgi:hypothetical protein